ncbi:MAG: AraC family transcriptional regulator [Provencibacterium sp.]|nr:AraC family transcriptional regulator [Provencibacterium sp.]
MEMFLRLLCERPVRFLSCGQFVGGEAFRHARRRLDNHCLILGQAGVLHMQQGGEPRDVGPGEMLLLRAGEEHSGSGNSSFVRYDWCHFTCLPEARERTAPEAEAVEDYYLLRQGAAADAQRTVLLPETLRLPQPDRTSVLFRQLMDYARRGYYTRCACDYGLTSLLIELTQQAADTYYTSYRPTGKARYSEVMEWIRTHADGPMTAGEVAARFSYNVNYLSGLVRQRTGYSLLQFIQKTRIDRARELLLSSDSTVREVAAQLGFPDEKYFMRLFKRLEGVTPTQFRDAFSLRHINIR